jgi:tetratricopeptide (TPR) repeat protein
MAESNREEIAKLEAILRNNPGGRVFTHLAEAYRKAGELDRARSILEAGILRHPDYASAHVVLGRVQMDQGTQEEAARSFRRVLELDPENRVALRSMGDLTRREHPAEALEHYRQLHALDPSDDDLAAVVERLKDQVLNSARPARPEGHAGQPHLEPVNGAAPANPGATPPRPDRGAPPIGGNERDLSLDWLVGGGADEEPWVESSVSPADASRTGEAPSQDSAAERAPSKARTEPAAQASHEIEKLLAGAGESRSGEATSEEVRTETLAELYRSQGFYDRSAEVYRALLQRRPDDARLRKRLEEVERLKRAEAANAGSEEPEPTTLPAPATELDPAPEPTPEAEEAWVEGVASAWATGAGAADSQAPYAWDPEPEEQVGGASLQDYLGGVLSWKPLERPQTAVSAADAVPTGPPAPSRAGDGAVPVAKPAGESEPDSRWWGDKMPSWEEPEVAAEAAGDPSDPVPGAVSAETASKPVANTAAGEQIGGSDVVEDAFQEWFTPDSAGARGAASPVDAKQSGPESGGHPAASAASEEESDDDLEMFRSWLQSLKR